MAKKTTQLLTSVAENAVQRAWIHDEKQRQQSLKVRIAGASVLFVIGLGVFLIATPKASVCPEGTITAGAKPPMGTLRYCATLENANTPDERLVRNGVYTEWYKDRGSWQDGRKVPTRRLQGVYKNDFENGVFRHWDHKGNLTSQLTYVDGALHGPYELYAEGALQEKGSYRNGLKSGPFVQYTPSGKVTARGQYREGKKQGEFSYYFSGQKLRRQEHFEMGVSVGEAATWYPSGQLKSKSQYVKGHPDGEWIRFYKSGAVKSSQNYREGAASGAWRTYSKRGQLLSEEHYAAGVLEGSSRLWHEDGELELDAFYTAGLPHGEWKSFDRAGDLVLTRQFSEGVLN